MTQTIDSTRIEQLREALAGRGVTMEYFETGPDALARLKELVPLGVEVQTRQLHDARPDRVHRLAERSCIAREGFATSAPRPSR